MKGTSNATLWHILILAFWTLFHTISSSGVTHLICHNCRYITDITTCLIVCYCFFEEPIIIMPMFSVFVVTSMFDRTEIYITDDLQTIFHIQHVGIFINLSSYQTFPHTNNKYNNNSCIVIIQCRNFVQANVFCRKCWLHQLHIYIPLRFIL